MKKYPKYKDSGYSWYGLVPTEWDVKDLKHELKFQTGGTPSTKDSKYYDGDNIWVTIGDMNGAVISESTSLITNEGIKAANIPLTPKGSLLYSFKLSVGQVAFAGKDLYTNEAIASFLPSSEYEISYWFYALPFSLIHYANENIYGAKLLNQELIKNAGLVIPPKVEQLAIVRFLDYKTEQIDNFIANRQKQIELLKEQKSEIINKAVTKGINPNVKMKDSGIEWIGEVPGHWKKIRLKNITKNITNGFVGSTSDILVESGARYIQALHVKENTIIFKQPYFVSEKWSNAHQRSILKEGDLVITQTGAMTGDVGLVPKEFDGCNCHALIIVKPNVKKVIPDFLLYLLTSNFGKSLLESIRTGSMHPHLNSTIVCNIDLQIPEKLSEQQSILTIIKEETSTIDTLISKYQKQIDLVQEYRTALISQAVTGKFDVRDWKPKRKVIL